MSSADVVMLDDEASTSDRVHAHSGPLGVGSGTSISSEPTGFQYSPTVGYVFDIQMTLHAPDEDNPHPEQPNRLPAIYNKLKAAKIFTRMGKIPIRDVEKYEVLLVHSEDHWDRVEALQWVTDQQRADSLVYYEMLSLYISPHTTKAARLSCGGVIEACLAVARGSLQKSLAIVRPPGHHAEPEQHMGFCFFNNVAIATRVVQQTTKVKKILILDWDVHHGNGTQKAFYDDPTVLYISLHLFEGGEFYPSMPDGDVGYCGVGPGRGFNVNIPWPQDGMGDADYLYAFQKLVMPIAMEFAPELVIVSCGFDAASGDPLGRCDVTPKGFAHMTWMLAGLAGGKMVVALEGGYNCDIIPDCALAVAKVILGEAPEETGPLVASEVATEAVWIVAKEQSKYWRNINVASCEPQEDVEPASHPLSDILKAHRYNFLHETYDMMRVPLLKQDLEAHFGFQVLCTPDLFDCSTLVVFAHELGNLRVGLASPMSCDANVEKTYLLDLSKQLIEWVRSEKYALIDINVMSRPQPNSRKSKKKDQSDPVAEVITYLWDNYIQLSGARRIIFLGHGNGCEPLISLIDRRFHSVTRIVKGIVQVVTNDVPRVPKKQELRAWYLNNSYVVVPSDHPILQMHAQKAAKTEMMHGKIIAIESKRKPVEVLTEALPGIATWVKEKAGHHPLVPRNHI